MCIHSFAACVAQPQYSIRLALLASIDAGRRRNPGDFRKTRVKAVMDSMRKMLLHISMEDFLESSADTMVALAEKFEITKAQNEEIKPHILSTSPHLPGQ